MSDLIIEGQVDKNEECIEELGNFLRTTLVIYLAVNMILDIVKFEEKDFLENAL